MWSLCQISFISISSVIQRPKKKVLFAFWEWLHGRECYLKGFFWKDPQQRFWAGGSCCLGTAQSVLLNVLCLLPHVLRDGRVWCSVCRLGYGAHVSSCRETSELGNAHRKTLGSQMICIFASWRKEENDSNVCRLVLKPAQFRLLVLVSVGRHWPCFPMYG